MWLGWHFVAMPVFLLELWRNYFLFTLDFFSIKLLLFTLLAPWRQEVMPKKRGFDIGGFFSGIIYNTYSRLMGAVCRLALIVTGIIAQVAVVLLGVAVFVVWYLLPFAVIFLAFLFFYV